MVYKLDLKLFRKANSLTQESASVYFECNQSFISLIETGRASIPESFIKKILSDEKIKKDGLSEIDEEQKSKNETTNYNIDNFFDVINKQLDMLAKRDEQIDRLITLLEKQINK